MAEPASPDRTTRPKELKAMLPIAYHLRLHSLKVLTGKTISELVSEALAAHFAQDPADVSALLAGTPGIPAPNSSG